MTAWASLTWQSPDPAVLAADLERVLGEPARAPARASAQVAGTRILRLGDADLELVDWRHEAPDDDPHAGGRLVFEPVEIVAADVADAADEAADRPTDEAADRAAVGEAIRANPALRLAGVCWATVELDRAEAELGPWLGPATAPRDGTEPHLGARTRARASRGLPGPVLVLAEPVTEGRLAASLARDGEGPCALYLEPVEGLDAWLAGAALRGVAVSAIRPGPLGPSVLIAGRPSGPHLVVVGGASSSRARRRPSS